MRVAVVDIGTNSTRLLVADVDTSTGALTELDRRTTVTRLGEGVDRSGRLAPEAMDRVFATLAGYRAAIEAHDATGATIAVLTSAVRDAVNGAEFTARVRDDYGLEARTIDGDEEAQLTYLGATSERDDATGEPAVVIDIGGGSTEFVVGSGREVTFHVSTQAGVVRQTERHLHTDPPKPRELQELTAEVRTIIHGAVPPGVRAPVTAAIGVAGTPTSCAAIAQELDPYDPEKVHGYRLSLATLELLLARLAAMPLAERREVTGLHPDRAPTIVAGVAMLIESLRAFGLDEVEVSEHDILRGAALRRAGVA
jgi:exopolyphosphatase/guanosine-5'-triphosphate,3'-diphosphate pyrophosphatase